MKSFLYTFHEKRKQPACVYTVRIYQIVRGVPKFVATMSDTFVSEFQLVMMCMEANKLLPGKAFARGGPSNSLIVAYASDLAKRGIANMTRVS